MQILSITQAQKKAYNAIKEDFFKNEEEWLKEENKKWFAENPPIFKDELTLDFYWGFVFFYDGKKAIEENNNEYSYFYRPPILVDKFTGELVKINLMPDILLDEKLEKYRKSKGYYLTAKFPVLNGIEKLPLQEQIKSYFRSGEFLQVKMGLTLIKENKLVDLSKFQQIVYHANFIKNYDAFEENILASFHVQEKLTFWGMTGEFFEEIDLFEDVSSLCIGGSQLNSIGHSILKLQQLKKITFRESEILSITPEILKLKNLAEITIWDSKMSLEVKDLFQKLELNNRVKISIIY